MFMENVGTVAIVVCPPAVRLRFATQPRSRRRAPGFVAAPNSPGQHRIGYARQVPVLYRCHVISHRVQPIKNHTGPGASWFVPIIERNEPQPATLDASAKRCRLARLRPSRTGIW